METRNSLRERLQAWQARGADAAYAVQMWRYALAHADEADDRVPVSAECDAVPYLPVQPETLGVALSADDCLVDLGCLGGYGLYDVAMRRRRAGLPVPRLIGVDSDETSIEMGRDLTETWDSGGLTTFHRASAEALPLAAASCRVLVARLLLPYVRIRETLQEVARVLEPGGLACFQVHAPSYYRHRMRTRWNRPALASYYMRPLLAGAWLTLTGRQPAGRRLRETALSSSRLLRLCAEQGLIGVWSGGFSQKPILIFRKRE